MISLTKAPSRATYIGATQRRARGCRDLTAKAAALWEQGLDTVAIARILNSENNCLLTEAVVAQAVARWRDKQARRS